MGIALLMGTLLGFLTGLGVGGGSLLVLWLTLGLGTDPGTARGINLLFFLPSALVACCFRWRQGSLKLRRVLPAAAAGCVAAGIFSWVGLQMDTTLLKKGFGLLLLATGLREIFYKPRSRPS